MHALVLGLLVLLAGGTGAAAYAGFIQAPDGPIGFLSPGPDGTCVGNVELRSPRLGPDVDSYVMRVDVRPDCALAGFESRPGDANDAPLVVPSPQHHR